MNGRLMPRKTYADDLLKPREFQFLKPDASETEFLEKLKMLNELQCELRFWLKQGNNDPIRYGMEALLKP